MEQKIRFEAEEKPQIENILEIIPNMEDFEEKDKAEAIIKNLGLKIGDTIREDNNYFIINPKMVLRGTSHKDYEKEIKLFKDLCTPSMIKQMTNQIKKKKESGDKQRDRFYTSFCKKLDKRLKVKSLIETEAVKYFTQEDSFKNCVVGLHNCVYHLLDISRELNEFKLGWENKPIPNTQEWVKENDGEYKVLTDSEADQEAEEYLTDDTELWKQAVDCGNTTQSLNDWAEYVLSTDGRGSILSGYDSCEESENINGETYYIYRTN